MLMETFYVDVETYYSQEYSLRKMTTVEYILDAQFECIGWAVAKLDGTKCWMSPAQFAHFLKRLPMEVTFVSHNALFDMGVCSWRFGYTPTIMVDTLGMARAMLSHKLKRLSLESVANYLGLGAKGKTVLKVIGMNRKAILDAGLMPEYGAYSIQDAVLCGGIMMELFKRGFPLSEIMVMDMVIRACVEPKFQLDQPILYQHLQDTQTEKATLLASTGLVDNKALMSNDQFAALLQSYGVDPPRKRSLTTGKETWAFAKTDAEFNELEEHPDPMVQALVTARLGIKSTIEESRTKRFIAISQLSWPITQLGNMPMPLRYSGAHTHRLSGEWALNVQNLSVRKGGAKLRHSLKAPKRYKVVVADASQIEARLTCTFCEQQDMMDGFARNLDLYAEFASEFFGFTVNKKTHPNERFVGKQCILGLGFGMGWAKFVLRIPIESRNQLGVVMVISDEDGQKVVNMYRRKYSRIAAMWDRLNNIIPMMCDKNCNIKVGPVTFKYQHVVLPNGMCLFYENLRHDGQNWIFEYGKFIKRLYGGKLLENIIQALDRVQVMEAAVRVFARTSFRMALQVHDELVYVVPEEKAAWLLQICKEELARRPWWMPALPLDADGNTGASYGECK